MTAREFMEKMDRDEFPKEKKRRFGIKDKDGNYLSDEEAEEYVSDLFDGGIPMGESYVRDFLWPKWGERLGIPKPD